MNDTFYLNSETVVGFDNLKPKVEIYNFCVSDKNGYAAGEREKVYEDIFYSV